MSNNTAKSIFEHTGDSVEDWAKRDVAEDACKEASKNASSDIARSIPSLINVALVIVNALNMPRGAIAASRLVDLLGAARRAGVMRFHLDDAAVAPEGNVEPTRATTSDIIPEPSDDEVLVTNQGGSAFHASALGVLLGAACIDNLFIAGDDGDFAATSLLREARARKLNVIVATDALSHGPARWSADHAGHAVESGANANADANTAQLATAVALIEFFAGCDPLIDSAQQREAIKNTRLLRTLRQRVLPPHTALVIIDVQNDFCDPAGANGRRDAAMGDVFAVSRQIPLLREAAREAGCLTIHVHAEYGRHVRNVGSPYRFPSKDTREGAVWSASAAAEIDEAQGFADNDVEVCLPGTWGADLIDALDVRVGDLTVRKHRFSAFIGTPLEAMLRGRGIRTVVVAGVTTNCCVESTVRDGAMLDFNMVVVSDCVAVKDTVKPLHTASLEQIQTYFGVVTTLPKLCEAWAV